MLLFICIKGTYLRAGQLQVCCIYGDKGVDAVSWTLKSLEVRSGPAPCVKGGTMSACLLPKPFLSAGTSHSAA